MKKLSSACAVAAACPGIYDPEDSSGDLVVIGKNAVFSDAYMNSEVAAGRDEVALTISRDLLVAITSCPACGRPKLIRNGQLIQCKGCGHIADELPSIKSKRLIEALKSIAEADATEPREPDDADWRWRFLEAQRVARLALELAL